MSPDSIDSIRADQGSSNCGSTVMPTVRSRRGASVALATASRRMTGTAFCCAAKLIRVSMSASIRTSMSMTSE